MKKYIIFTLLFSLHLSSGPVQAGDDKFYGPVIDLNARLGSERTLGRVEIQVPLKQTRDNLFFTDIRTVLGDQDDLEGNFGLGYRQVVDIADQDFVVGGYGFYDRRRSEIGNYFSQVTVGGEVLADKWRGRVNAYYPVSEEKVISDAPDTATLTPDGFVSVNPNTVVETALNGFDIELGYKVPFFKENETWGHVSYYRFGLGTDPVDLNGLRFRGETQINDWLRLGVESSYDNVRKDNHFFDIRVRIPLQKENVKKRAALTSSIRRYMQEPIVRDVDIVATNASLDAALATDGTGRPERYYFVDNTAPAGGNGRPDTPFSSLAEAEANVRNRSTIYVRTGDGTTANMDGGITITNNRVRLLGAGVDLRTRNMGILVEDASIAPRITNTGGDAIVVDANRVEVAGFNIDSPLTDGVFVLDDNNVNIHDNTITNAGNNGINAAFVANQNRNITIQNNTVTGSALRGIYVRSFNGGRIRPTVTGNVSNGNTQEGIRYEVGSSAGSQLQITSGNNIANMNGGTAGIYSVSAGDGRLRLTSNGDTANNNTASGFFVMTGGTSTNQTVTASNITANTNGQTGIAIDIQDDSGVTLNLSNTSTSANISDGLNIISRSNTVLNATVSNHTSTGNTQQGVDITADGTSTVMTIGLDNISSMTSGNSGMFLRARSSGTLNATLVDSMIENNTNAGLFLEGAGSGNANIQVDRTDLINSTTFNLQLSNTTSGVYNIDLGGGALGSAGQNRVFTSGNVDVFGNLNGNNVSAQSNWWGVGTGLAGGELNLTSGGSVDASNHLVTDPRP